MSKNKDLKKLSELFDKGGKLGVENLKIALKETIEFAVVIFKAFDDGKLKLGEGIDIFWQGKDVTIIIDNWEAIKAEYADLTTEELEELKVYVAKQFDIENDVAELRIEKAFNLVAAIQDLMLAFKK